MTASNDMRVYALGIMKTRFGRRWTTDYASLFERAFDAMKDDQVRTALEAMLDSYTYHDPMSPAEFKQWGGIREQDSEKRRLQPFMFTSPETGVLQAEVKLLDEECPQSNDERQVSRAAGKERLRTILAVREGEIRNPLTAFERALIVSTPDSRNEAIMVLRNRQRKALGWGPVP